MTSEPLEVRVSAVFDYCAAYVGGEKIKIDRLKKDTLKQMSLLIIDPP